MSGDNPSDSNSGFARAVERLSKEEQRRKELESREEDITPGIEDEPDLESEIPDEETQPEIPAQELLERDAMDDRREKLSPENGEPVQPKGYDPLLNEIENIVGYNPDSDSPEIAGEVVDEEIDDGAVKAVYTLTEPLVDTSRGEIRVPGIELFADSDYLSIALENDDQDLEIERTPEGGYRVEISYEADKIEEAIQKTAQAIVDIDEELARAYRSER